MQSLTQSNGNQRVPLCSGLSLSSRPLKCVIYDPWRHSAASAVAIIYWDRGQKIRTFGIIRTKGCDLGDRIPSNHPFFPFFSVPFTGRCLVKIKMIDFCKVRLLWINEKELYMQQPPWGAKTDHFALRLIKLSYLYTFLAFKNFSAFMKYRHFVSLARRILSMYPFCIFWATYRECQTDSS